MMSFFSFETEPMYVALLDIGSASVTGSIAYSPPNGDPELLWSTQERILLKQLKSRNETGKHLLAALMNVVLELGQDGLQHLREHYPKAHIDTMQVSVAAPWSYTIIKQAHYNKEESFIVTQKLYDDLLHSLEETVAEELREHEVSQHLGLTVTSRMVTTILANGYTIEAPKRQKARSLQLSLSNTVLQEYLYEAILDVHSKVLPATELRISSFVLQLFCVLQEIHPEMQEYCIINQTMEATELGVVRNNELVYSTHEPYGIVSLARDLSEIYAVSIDEVFGLIQSGSYDDRYAKLTKEKQFAVDKVLGQYHKIIEHLLQQTGDKFTIPKSIFIHTHSCTYDFFAKHIETGAAAATGLKHIVHSIDQELLKQHTGLEQRRSDKSCVELVSVSYFHTHKLNARFIAR